MQRIKKIEILWNDGRVVVGILIVLGVYIKNKGVIEDSEQKLYENILNRKEITELSLQVFSSTWYLPDETRNAMKEMVSWKIAYDWISIFYFVYSEKR
ncbi:MAG: hypothetical protein LBT51_09655 [Fusobacteriaceae bacterium]|nr:hypothetical protein [Fusobacteriaceae bacterium]